MEVYVFGAGASAAEGAPVTEALFPRAWVLLGPSADRRVAAVWRFLEQVFGVRIRSAACFHHLPAVDEVISLVDWSLQTHQGLGHLYDPPRLHEIRRDLEYLVQVTLRAAVQRAADRRGGPHARLVRRLWARGLLKQVAFISLNYDTLLDNALARIGVMPDYGLNGGTRQEGPLLAKLHGSLNWALCPACGRVAAPENLQAVREATGPVSRCERCDNPRLRGLIIPPTLQKSYPGAGLQQVWDRALEAIQSASRITFVGYSMPPGDIPVYHLIRRGLLTRRRGGRPAIRVINHQRADLSPTQRRLERNALIGRFHRLFGPEVSFDFSGFHGQI